jgi:four helix bundle protein
VTIRSFRDLRVWQQGMELVEAIYLISSSFPKEELYGLTSQIRRAAVSIPANIAEGHTREHRKEYLNYVSMAQASLAELQTELEIALRLKYVPTERADPIFKNGIALAKQLYSLRNALLKV